MAMVSTVRGRRTFGFGASAVGVFGLAARGFGGAGAATASFGVVERTGERLCGAQFDALDEVFDLGVGEIVAVVEFGFGLEMEIGIEHRLVGHDE
jgi:hypothetical protein